MLKYLATECVNLMNLVWVFSILSIRYLWWGFHTGELYSRIGLTYVQKASFKTSWSLEEKDALIVHETAAALWVIVSMWVANFKQGSIVIPRYLTLSMCWRVWPLMEYSGSFFLLSATRYRVNPKVNFSGASWSCQMWLHWATLSRAECSWVWNKVGKQ